MTRKEIHRELRRISGHALAGTGWALILLGGAAWIGTVLMGNVVSAFTNLSDVRIGTAIGLVIAGAATGAIGMVAGVAIIKLGRRLFDWAEAVRAWHQI